VKFNELPLEQELLEGLQAMNFKETTPVQEKTIPIILDGKDIIASAQTVTGKTAAYLLPILNMLCKEDHPQNTTNALIMVPTRELAQQIDQQLEGFAYFLPVSSVAVYGGGDGAIFEQQKKALLSGVDVVIATPGRLLSLLAMGSIDLSDVKFFILDEADRMLDMGFLEDILQVSSYLSKKRQTLLFSATMPHKIRELAKKLLHQPEEIRLAVSKPAEKIKQSAFICYENQKIGIIKNIFASQKTGKVVVFSSSKQKVKDVSAILKKSGLAVGEMHSDLEQKEREEIIRNFKNNNINILIATDIVSRGIDIEDIELVINFDVPNDSEDYIHRIGRTARASAEGRAITFVSEKEQAKFKQIETFIEKEIPKEIIPKELGEGPEYNPEKFAEKEKKHFRRKGKSIRTNKNGKK
jgi:superfamily II DNA/RNA helicase